MSVLIKPGYNFYPFRLCRLLNNQAAYVDHDYSDAFVVKIVGEQLSNHVLSGFASVVSIISTALFLCSQLDGSPFGTDENKFRA